MKTVLRGQGIWGRCANPDRHCRARHRTFREPIWEKAPYAKARLLMVRAGFGVASILTAPLRARFASSNATLRRFFAGSGWGWVHKSGKMKPKSRWFWLVAGLFRTGNRLRDAKLSNLQRAHWGIHLVAAHRAGRRLARLRRQDQIAGRDHRAAE